MVQMRLLGSFGLWHEQVVVPVKTQALRELMAYLALQNKPVRREVVASDLWGEQTTGDALKKLRQQLWLLRSLLNDHDLCEIELLECEHQDTLQLELHGNVEVDVYQLRQAGRLLAPGLKLGASELALLDQATTHYQSDLLEGCCAEWCLRERERYRDLMGSIFARLIAYCQERAQWKKGFEYAQQALQLEPTRESVHYQAILLHVGQGDFGAAIRQYERCAQALKDAYGVAPSASTQALIGYGTTPSSFGTQTKYCDLLETVQRLQSMLCTLVQSLEKT